MPCGDEMALLLSRYVDGELAPEEKARADAHLADCAPCRELKSLFDRNESLLAGALSTEAFGNDVIASVLTTIREDERAPEATPAARSFWDRVRERPWIPMTAAVFLVAVLVFLLDAAASRRQAELSARYDVLDAKYRGQVSLLAGQYEESEKRYLDLLARQAIQKAGEGLLLAYVEPDNRVRVYASFDPSLYENYCVFRRREDDPRLDEGYVEISEKDRLKQPVFYDATAQPGEGYFYMFRAYRSNGQFEESASIHVKVRTPGDLEREKSIRIRCDETAARGNMAVFTLERVHRGRTVKEQFDVQVGQRIGGARDIPGLGRVDFSTDLELDRIELGDQWFDVCYTTPVLDSGNTPVKKKLENGKLVPAVSQSSVSLGGSRDNMRAFVRPAGAPAGKDAGHIWKGGWIWVRARS